MTPNIHIYPEFHSHGSGRAPSRVWTGEATIDGKLHRIRRNGLEDVVDYLRTVVYAYGAPFDLQMLETERQKAMSRSSGDEWRFVPGQDVLQCNRLGQFLYKGSPVTLRRTAKGGFPHITVSPTHTSRISFVAKNAMALTWIAGSMKGDRVECIDGDPLNVSVANLRNLSLEQRKARADMRDVPGIIGLRCSWYGLFEYRGRELVVNRNLSREGYKVPAFIEFKSAKRTCSALRLIASTWHDGYFPNCIVVPKDGNPWNIDLSNCEIMSEDDYIEAFGDSQQVVKTGDNVKTIESYERIKHEIELHLEYIKTGNISQFNKYITQSFYDRIRDLSMAYTKEMKAAEECTAQVLSIIYERFANGRRMTDMLRYARFYVREYAEGKDLSWYRSSPVLNLITEAGLSERWYNNHRLTFREVMAEKIKSRANIRDAETQSKLKLLKMKYNAG